MNLRFSPIVFLVMALSASCGKLPEFAGTEMALCEGAVLSTRHDGVEVGVQATSALDRIFIYGNTQLETALRPRYQRWNGSLGAYQPSGHDEGYFMLVDEGQQHFRTTAEAQDWLFWRMSSPIIQVRAISDDGVVLLARLSDKDEAFSADIWQIMVDGQKAKQLSVASFKTLDLEVYRNDCGTLSEYDASRLSHPKTINGREYSGRVIDTMHEQGISATTVEDIIRKGDKLADGVYLSYTYIDASSKFIGWAFTDQTGRVVVVGT